MKTKNILKTLSTCFEIANNLRTELLELELDAHDANLDATLDFEQSNTIDQLDALRTELDLLIGELSRKA